MTVKQNLTPEMCARLARIVELATGPETAATWNTAQIAEEFGVNPRTVKRELAFLRSLGFESKWSLTEGRFYSAKKFDLRKALLEYLLPRE